MADKTQREVIINDMLTIIRKDLASEHIVYGPPIKKIALTKEELVGKLNIIFDKYFVKPASILPDSVSMYMRDTEGRN
jgi:hypothetical protein